MQYLSRIDGPADLRCLTAEELFVGAEEIRRLVTPLGYRVVAVPVRGCLHLKSAVTEVGEATVLLNPEMVDPLFFDGLHRIQVDPQEPAAANALRAGDVVIAPAHHPRTRARLQCEGLRVLPVEASELAKAEGGVTCCSLLVD